MSQSFRCDICGDCVSAEADAQSQREVVRQPTTILGVQLDLAIIIKAYVPHVCNTCWGLVMGKVKAWVQANL
jgi:hypothetical protein